MPRTGVRFYKNTLGPKMTLFALGFDRGLKETVEDMAQEVEEYAKQNAPWGDRTGAARDGLTAQARHRLGHYYIDLFHTVEYGIWLEIRFDGEYAIIEPTLEQMGPKLMSELSMGEILGNGLGP